MDGRKSVAGPTRSREQRFLIRMDGGIAVGSVLLGGVVQMFGYAGIFRYSIVFLLLLLVVLAVGMLRRDSMVSVEE
ncbi:hypothetical protein M3223_23320 [Paenibacillus pasadenensis]|nr:hypothetical protein [Paenibacillus pasadenensis]